MDTSNLKAGMVVKNYIELCKLLGESIKTGNAKRAHLKEIERYVKLQKIGYEFLINEIYKIPKDKIDGRIVYKYNIDLTLDIYQSKGVYCFKNNNKIYIGSTNTTFKDRFTSHRTGKISFTRWLSTSENCGFEILETIDNSTEPEIRMREKYYINLYSSDGNYTVMNKKSPWSYTVKKIILKKKIIQVLEKNYKQAIKLLKENNLL